MLNRLHASFVELERTRALVGESCSLDELHRVVNQLMRDALACSKESSESSLDELIESLADICIALFDKHGLTRKHLLFLVDQALTRKTLPPAARNPH